jgi:hypothetical protein
MRVLLLNDTRADENPGCQATVASLVSGLSRLTSGEVVTRLRGDGYEHFASLIADGEAFSSDRWQTAVRRFALESDLPDALRDADLVVANLEGTFHHHTVGALSLGGAMAIAHRMGKRVWAVNGSVEAIEPWLLSAALAPAEWLSVREPISHRWLVEQGLNARSAADCVFLMPQTTNLTSLHSPTALFTPGVLASLGHPSCDPKEVVHHLEVLEAHGWKPIFLRMADAEETLARAAREAGWAVDDNRSIRWQDFSSYLQQFGLVVSGRYHVLLFAAMAGVPAVALRSNTWKIEGLIELVGNQIARASDAGELATILRHAPPRPVDRFVIRVCQSAARSSLPARLFSADKGHGPVLSFRTALFGASSLGQAVATRLKALPHVELTGFLDNDPAKWGTCRNDLSIAQPTQETLAAADVIVITSMHSAQIRDQVNEAGFGHKLTDVASLERLAP